MTLGDDLALTVALGALGGFAVGLLQEKGLEMPHVLREDGVTFADLGFLADIVIGAIAAVLMYAVTPPESVLELAALAIASGVGGTGILKSYVKGFAAREWASRAQEYRSVAEETVATLGPPPARNRLDSLAVADARTRRRWGPR